METFNDLKYILLNALNVRCIYFSFMDSNNQKGNNNTLRCALENRNKGDEYNDLSLNLIQDILIQIVSHRELAKFYTTANV
jgi:hypothetical protein